MLRLYFEYLKAFNCTKNRAPDLLFWRYGVKGSTFPPLPQKLSGQIPSIFCTEYPRDDPQNHVNFVKVSPPVSEIFGIFSFS